MYVLVHKSGDAPCGNAAFLLAKRPAPGAVIDRRDFLTLGGFDIPELDEIRCGSCGRPVTEFTVGHIEKIWLSRGIVNALLHDTFQIDD